MTETYVKGSVIYWNAMFSFVSNSITGMCSLAPVHYLDPRSLTHTIQLYRENVNLKVSGIRDTYIAVPHLEINLLRERITSNNALDCLVDSRLYCMSNKRQNSENSTFMSNMNNSD